MRPPTDAATVRDGARLDAVRPNPPRIVVYTHDTYGMGHIRRCMNIIEAVADIRPDAAILLLTGSPALNVLDRRRQNVDVVKLPTIAPTGPASERPPHLPIGTSATIRLRRAMIKEVVRTFVPDVFLVDNFALGARKELLPALEFLRDLPTRTILGLRDIVDDAETVTLRWERDGIYAAIRDLYDSVLVYGDRAVFDIGEAYDLDAVSREKLRYCGYVARPRSRNASADGLLAELGLAGPTVLLTVGGGGDGLPLIRTFLEAMAMLPDISALVVTGPLMGTGARKEIELLSRQVPRVVVREFLPNLTDYMVAADLVVSMGGYNTVAELVRNGCRSVIVPRNWRYGQHQEGTAAGLEMEQLMRAELLQGVGLAAMLHPQDLDPSALAAVVRRELAAAKPVRKNSAFAMDGAEMAAKAICAGLAPVGGVCHAS